MKDRNVRDKLIYRGTMSIKVRGQAFDQVHEQLRIPVYLRVREPVLYFLHDNMLASREEA